MASDKVKIISYNVNGLLNPIKRSKILTKMKKERAHVVYLQETHLNDKEHEKLKRMGFTNLFFSSYKLGHRRGVAILISKQVNFEKISEIKDKEGRYVLVKGNIDGNIITLLNIYAPPGSDMGFFQKIIDIIITKTEGLLICGGDLNIHLQPQLDSSSGKTYKTKSLYRKVNTLFKDVGLIDIWRELFPQRRDYTHYSAPHSIYTRIDYFITFGRDRDKTHTCDIGTIDLSDHAPIYLTVDLDLPPRNTLWKLNSGLLNDPCFKQDIRKEMSVFLEFNDNDEVSPLILWDTMKAVLRGKIIAIASHKKRQRKKALEELQQKLKNLESKHKTSSDGNTFQEIEKIRNEIRSLTTQDIKRNLMYLKQRHYESGPKSMKILAWKLKKKLAENTVHKIRHPRTKEIKNKLSEIHEAFEAFYKKLYTRVPGGGIAQIDTFLNTLKLPTLNEEQNQELIAVITENELQAAISRLKAGTAPGSDGYTAEWYKEFKNDLIPIILPTLNWVLGKAQTPPSWKEAIISAIPKEGKDKTECASYRPISVLNIDYKMFTSIMARRLEKFMTKLIHNDQTGFIHQRQTQDNIRRTLHIMNHIAKNKMEAIVISIDAEKAFDSVNWDFLYRTLHRFGFHARIIKTIQSLYNNPTARVKVNGYLSNRFTLERGTRQGCAWSPILFALFLEPLAQYTRQNREIRGIQLAEREHKLACYADDVLVYLSQPTHSLPQLMLALEKYGQLSGYKVNVGKTQVLAYNYNPTSEMESKYPWSWQAKSFKYLGITIPKDLSKLSEYNYSPIHKKIKEDITRWNLVPFFSFSSRIQSIKMNILPRLLYLFQTLPIEVTQGQLNEWDKMLSRYLWQGKRPRVRLKTLQLVKEKGGWGLPSLKEYYYAAQTRAIICWCNPSYNAQWKDIEEKIFPIPIQAIIADSKLQHYINSSDNPWVKLTLKVWKNIIREYKLEDLLSLKWCGYDSDFTPNKMDTRLKKWRDNGITALCNIMNGNILFSFEMIQEKYLLEKQDFFRYLQLRHFVNENVKKVTEANSSLIELFKRAYKSNCSKGVISAIYKRFLDLKTHSTAYIKAKWEKESGIDISEEEWTLIWGYQWKCTSSMSWREFNWKNCIRYFITPSQTSHYSDNVPVCWRKCGHQSANHYHIFWDCPIIKNFWKAVHNALQDIFREDIPLDFKILYLGNIPQSWLKGDRHLINAMLVASKKTITRKWLLPECPTITSWRDIVTEIYRMEQITAHVNQRMETFLKHWQKWCNYVTDKWPDCISLLYGK